MNDELRMQAWMDDELSTSEATELEKNLTPAERKRLAAERNMETALAARLSDAPACPDATWLATLDTINSGQPRKNTPSRGKVIAIRTAVALAAMIVLIFSIQSSLNETMAPPSDIPAGLSYETASAVTGFFEDEQVALELSEARDDHHALALIGARRASMNNETVHEVYYTCCDRPVQVVVAPDGSRAASRILHNAGSGNVQQVRNIGNYVAGLLSDHETPGLLDNMHVTASLALLMH